MKTVLYIVRHGESIGNRLKRLLGHTDLGLTELGLSQASATAEALSHIDCAKIYSSDLLRAMQTALPHAALRGIEVIPESELREIYLGEWEDRSVEEVITEYGEKFTVEWREQFGIFSAPGGESVPALAERIHSALIKIARENSGKTIFVATHAAAIRAVWGKISGILPGDLAAALPFPSNASYSIVEYDGERLLPIAYSQDEHLVEMRTVWRD